MEWEFDPAYPDKECATRYYNVWYLVDGDSQVGAVWREHGMPGWEYGLCGSENATGQADTEEEIKALCLMAYKMR